VIRVVVADDQELVRAGFRVLIDSADDLEVVGEAADGEEAVQVVLAQQPDVVLMDVRMPLLDGIEATRRICQKKETARSKIIMLTTFDRDEYVHDALRAGASGFLLKDARPADLLDAIRTVAGGEALLAPRVTRRLIEEFLQLRPSERASPKALEVLTDRERDVLKLVAQGRSNAEIADALVMSHATAKTHVSRILTKMHARDRSQLVVLAYEIGLISPGG
jgi:DNA-binding NarL/FixJ family response regulator